jgi:hypothetical protein
VIQITGMGPVSTDLVDPRGPNFSQQRIWSTAQGLGAAIARRNFLLIMPYPSFLGRRGDGFLFAQTSGTHSTKSTSFVPTPGLTFQLPEGSGEAAIVTLNLP